MKNLLKFCDRHLAYLLITPAVAFILLFSILPIFESLKYAFFDFQLNDQTKSGLYLNAHFNMPLYQETLEYMDYFLDIEESVVTKEETFKSIIEAKTVVAEANERFAAYTPIAAENPIIKISKEQSKEIIEMNKRLVAAVDQVYSHNETSYYSKEDMYAVMTELESCLIKSNFTALENFSKILGDKRVLFTLSITLVFTVVSVAFELIFGLMLAMIMNKTLMGRGVIRTISLIPWAIPTSVAALMWAYLYNGSSGIVAHLMSGIGLIGSPADLLLTSSGALGAIILADVWKTTPYMALLLLAGLQVISTSLYEASSLDGASKWQEFIHITLPLLKPSILVALLFRTLDAFRVFDLIYVLTGGGPGGTTESLSVYAYKVIFAQTRFGYGSAMIIVMAVVVGIISYLYIKFLNVQVMGD